MDWNRECAAVIPCYNEAGHIYATVRRVREHLAKVIVVDDGSRDDTASLAAEAGAEVIRLPRNSGKGAALRQGWRRAQELGFDWAMMLDGDGQHDAEEIPKFLARAQTTGAALVVGNRFASAQAMPLVRRVVNRWMSRRISRLTGAELPDSQCGFRLAHLAALLQLPLAGNRFEIESAMLVAFTAAGTGVEFVPVRCIYELEKSKINPLTDTYRWLRWRLAQRTGLRACNVMRVP